MSESLDLRGLKCPLPALLTRRALRAAAAGTVFEVLCDDPLCGIDIPHMCREEKIEIVDEKRDGRLTRLWLRRVGDGLDVADNVLGA
ncbi:MAG: sulfurtransferase TusA family protein [Rhizomicrobium sp.]|nr:sulfurtransferase TusA family protein [Rhizomicrobium sp.]